MSQRQTAAFIAPYHCPLWLQAKAQLAVERVSNLQAAFKGCHLLSRGKLCGPTGEGISAGQQARGATATDGGTAPNDAGEVERVGIQEGFGACLTEPAQTDHGDAQASHRSDYYPKADG